MCGVCAVYVRSLCGVCAILVRSLCYFGATLVRSLCYFFATLARSLCYFVGSYVRYFTNTSHIPGKGKRRWSAYLNYRDACEFDYNIATCNFIDKYDV